jgi:hypothetical protein
MAEYALNLAIGSAFCGVGALFSYATTHHVPKTATVGCVVLAAFGAKSGGIGGASDATVGGVLGFFFQIFQAVEDGPKK